MSTNFFSSLSGSYDYISSMSGLLSDYSSIKSGAYGSLMKSYVNKVGNSAALQAYRETGSTTTADSATSTISTKSSSAAKKSSFLDNHFESISSQGKSASSKSDSSTASASVSTDAYAKYKSSWLDDQLKQYDKDANKTTAADTSVSYDTTI